MKLTIEQLEFPLSVKKRILLIKSINKLNVEFVTGRKIIFNNTNIGLFEPHKIIIINDKSSIVLFKYEENSSLYINDLSNQISISKLSELIQVMSK